MATASTQHRDAARPEPVQKCALVTGSSNGIGEAVVLLLAEMNYKLVVTGRSGADVERVAAECARRSPSGLEPLQVVADLEQEPDVDMLFERAMHHFGHTLDLLVNNAAIGCTETCDQPDTFYAAFKRVAQINLFAPVRLSLLARAPLAQTARRARKHSPHATTSIVHVASIAATRVTAAGTAYSSLKASLVHFCKCTAPEFGPHVRVNCVSPGPVATKIIARAGWSLSDFEAATGRVSPLRRCGAAEEVARAIVFLADGRQSGFTTGAELVLDGGISCHKLGGQGQQCEYAAAKTGQLATATPTASVAPS